MQTAAKCNLQKFIAVPRKDSPSSVVLPVQLRHSNSASEWPNPSRTCGCTIPRKTVIKSLRRELDHENRRNHYVPFTRKLTSKTNSSKTISEKCQCKDSKIAKRSCASLPEKSAGRLQTLRNRRSHEAVNCEKSEEYAVENCDGENAMLWKGKWRSVETVDHQRSTHEIPHERRLKISRAKVCSATISLPKSETSCEITCRAHLHWKLT